MDVFEVQGRVGGPPNHVHRVGRPPLPIWGTKPLRKPRVFYAKFNLLLKIFDILRVFRRYGRL